MEKLPKKTYSNADEVIVALGGAGGGASQGGMGGGQTSGGSM